MSKFEQFIGQQVPANVGFIAAIKRRLKHDSGEASLAYIRELEAKVASQQAVIENNRAELDDKAGQIVRLRTALAKVKADRNDIRQRFNEYTSRAKRGKR